MTENIAGYDVNFRRRLGRGAIGFVYLATDKNGVTIAAKQVDNMRSDRAAIREIDNAQKQSRLDHKNIVKILHVVNEEDIWVFMEYLDGGDLGNFAINHYAELKSMRVDLMIQILRGLSYLHDSKICHRDIKPENILVQLGKSIVVKLTDFGLAKFPDPNILTTVMKTKLGTANYMAPELFAEDVKYRKSVDIFAVGLTFQAILQMKISEKLKPEAVGWTEPESSQAIGVIMYMRHMYGQPQLTVVEHRREDGTTIKAIKYLVERATLFKPDDRPTAQDMLSDLEALRNTAVSPSIEEKTIKDFLKIVIVILFLGIMKVVFGNSALIGSALYMAIIAGCWSLFPIWPAIVKNPLLKQGLGVIFLSVVQSGFFGIDKIAAIFAAIAFFGMIQCINHLRNH